MQQSEIGSSEIRWTKGERLSHLYEARCDSLASMGRKEHLAIDAEDGTYSFAELDRRANAIARRLLSLGIGPGSRVGLLLDRSRDAYAALLAAIKANVTFVPLDASYPSDRIAFIVADAGLAAVLCAQRYLSRLGGVDVTALELEIVARDAETEATTRLDEKALQIAPEPLSYIVYTSGSTGNPKGVAISHASICNFVRVAGEVYGVNDRDRAYQGMTLAFDFSVEELWVPLIAGATIVPAPSEITLVGLQLSEFLVEKRVTALCCVPTLLATITRDLPQLRFLLVSGEACPHDLVVRWHRQGRRMLNAYGPTEATVTATWTELHPDKPVTIGKPLPTYSILILAVDQNAVVQDGEIGEIAIAGVGLADGYVNLPDRTATSFIADFVGVPNNPSGRLYRTGDLGRINTEGEIEYHGRIDTQVKVRGYRIELTEIESALLQFAGIAQAVVKTFKQDNGQVALAAYFTTEPDIPAIDPRDIARHLRTRLPGYMVPAFIDPIEHIPMLASNKADRKRLPDPAGPRLILGGEEFVPPRTATEATIAAALAKVLGLDQVSVTDDVFTDLGGDSMLMTEFVFEMQDRRPDWVVSIRDVYMQRTIEKLARVVEAGAPSSRVEPINIVRPSRLQHMLCGLAQYVFYVTVAALWLLIGIEAYKVQAEAETFADAYLRSVLATNATFAFAILMPIAAKWLLIGRWREETFPIWSWRYFRFWMVKQLLQTNPLVLFRGQPVYNTYLRLLGAKIGKHASINPRFLPVVTDLLEVGEGAVIAKDCLIQGYRAEHGVIRTGAISIGCNAYVGESSVLDIGTAVGTGGQLAHVSSLQTGQSIPEAGRYWGSPAVPTSGDFIPVPSLKCGGLRRCLYSILTFALLSGVLLPAIDLGMIGLARAFGPKRVPVGSIEFLGWDLVAPALAILAGSLSLFVAGILGGIVVAVLLPRLLAPLVRPDHVYPLFGFHYAIACLVSWLSNSYVNNILFGDSSFIVHYLRLIGFDLSTIRQTGSNFGSHQRHDSPFLCRVGSGTMASDGLSMVNFRQSNTSFKLSKADIGDGSFLGNQIVYLAGARLGTGNLLATKVMVPVDGPIRSDVGLLGSPPFEIPRTVVSERSFDPLLKTPEQQRRLAAKNRHNLVTLAYYLMLMWVSSALSMALFYAAYHLYPEWGAAAIVAAAAVLPMLTVAYYIVMEQWGPGAMQLEPNSCTIHDLHFWRVERYWKMGETPLKLAFKGTPFRPWIYRMLGVHMGHMVFDDGCVITEKSLTHIGDYCCFNESTSLQCHSLEDGLFKSDNIRIGSDCTIGLGAFVNYGAEMRDRSVLCADSFLMKGSTVGEGETWVANPSRRL